MKYKLSLLLVFVTMTSLLFGSSFVAGADTTKCVIDKDTKECIELKPGQVTIERTDVKGLQDVSADKLIKNTLNAVYATAAVVAVIVIVAAGIMYIVSDGDPGKTSIAKNAIIYSAVGLVIVGSAFIITGIVQRIGS